MGGFVSVRYWYLVAMVMMEEALVIHWFNVWCELVGRAVHSSDRTRGK